MSSSFTRKIFLSSNGGDRYPLGQTRTDKVNFDLVTPILCRSDQRIYMTLTSFACPNTLYNVPDGRNVIKTSLYTATIPFGQYNSVTDFTSAVQSALTASGITITVTFNALKNKLLFQNTGATSLTLLGATTSLWYRIGLIENLDFTIAAGATTMLPRMIDLSAGRSINFALTNFDFQSMDSHGTSTSSSASILANVPLNVNFGSIQTFSDEETKTLVSSKNISELDVSLLSLDDDDFDIGGLKWSATLLITVE